MNREIFTEDHHVAAVENTVNQICDPFFKQNGLAFFVYGKVYRDKKISMLSTNAQLERLYINNQLPLSLPNQVIYNAGKKQFFSISSDSKLQEGSKFCNKFFNLDHFIGIIKPFNDYIEVSIFGALAEKHNILNFYLNNLNILESFNLDFKKTAKEIILESEKNKILLPTKTFNPAAKLFNNSNADQITLNNNFNPLTKREIECIEQIMMGKTSKKIAQNLKISYKTVEFHIENIKSKLNCYRKSDIIEKLSAS